MVSNQETKLVKWADWNHDDKPRELLHRAIGESNWGRKTALYGLVRQMEQITPKLSGLKNKHWFSSHFCGIGNYGLSSASQLGSSSELSWAYLCTCGQLAL